MVINLMLKQINEEGITLERLLEFLKYIENVISHQDVKHIVTALDIAPMHSGGRTMILGPFKNLKISYENTIYTLIIIIRTNRIPLELLTHYQRGDIVLEIPKKMGYNVRIFSGKRLGEECLIIGMENKDSTIDYYVSFIMI
jgi:hypothetical protein